MKKFSTLSHNFLKYLEKEKKRSKKTIENYKFYLSRFVDFFDDKKPDKITKEAVLKYRKWLNKLIDVHGEPLKKNTQNYHLIALRNFLKYLESKKLKVLPYRVIKLDIAKISKPSILNKTDIENLLVAPLQSNFSNKANNLLNHRNKALLELLFSAGLLVSEVSKLKKTSINLNKKEFIITNKKGIPRAIPLTQQAKYWINQYLDLRIDTNQYLFISHDKRTGKINDGGITPRTIQRIVNKCAKSVGIQKSITPHTLRHSYTLSMIKSGANTKDIQNLLGISNDNSKRYC